MIEMPPATARQPESGMLKVVVIAIMFTIGPQAN
jgi:hypothetical protein